MTIIDLGALDGAELVEPLSLAEAKTWARIERDDEDALISGLIRAARQTMEEMTGLVLAQRGFRLALDPVPADGWVEIARRPLGPITAIAVYGADGVPQAFAPSEGVVERALGIEAIRLSPTVRMASVNGVEVDFTAGFADGDTPENLVLALKTIVAASYEFRTSVGLSQQPAIMPPLARTLIAPFRRLSL